MIIPAMHRVLVRQLAVVEHDEDRKRLKNLGLELPPENEREQASVDVGHVVRIGETAFKDFGYDRPEDVIQVDDLISFAKGSGKPLKDPYTGEEFLVINDQDVVCVFKKEE